jgi:predicted HicB family RNase H-like nuclease
MSKNLIEYKGYHGSVNFDDEELIFYGKLEFIQALVTYEATTAKQLKKEFENAVDDYLESCKLKQLEPEQPFKGSLNIRLGKELHRKIALAANNSETSINAFIKNYLEQATSQNQHH